MEIIIQECIVKKTGLQMPMNKNIKTLVKAVFVSVITLNPLSTFAIDPFLKEALRRQALKNLGYDHDPQLQYQIDVQRRRSELLRQYHPEIYNAEQDYARDLFQGSGVHVQRPNAYKPNKHLSKSKTAHVEVKSKEALDYDRRRALENAKIKQAAEQGNPDAQRILGLMYEFGDGFDNGVPMDKMKAFEWYKKAGEQGNSQAQVKVGEMLIEGRTGIVKDEAKAFDWFKKASEQGNDEGQWYLGNMYNEGKGVLQDKFKAIEWLKKAAEKGNKLAKDDLSRMAANGECVNAGVPVHIPGSKGTIIRDNRCK